MFHLRWRASPPTLPRAASPCISTCWSAPHRGTNSWVGCARHSDRWRRWRPVCNALAIWRKRSGVCLCLLLCSLSVLLWLVSVCGFVSCCNLTWRFSSCMGLTVMIVIPFIIPCIHSHSVSHWEGACDSYRTERWYSVLTHCLQQQLLCARALHLQQQYQQASDGNGRKVATLALELMSPCACLCVYWYLCVSVDKISSVGNSLCVGRGEYQWLMNKLSLHFFPFADDCLLIACVRRANHGGRATRASTRAGRTTRGKFFSFFRSFNRLLSLLFSPMARTISLYVIHVSFLPG